MSTDIIHIGWSTEDDSATASLAGRVAPPIRCWTLADERTFQVKARMP
jgi:hypothetical protein